MEQKAKIPKVELSFKLYQQYLLLMSLSILSGTVGRIIIKIDKNSISKNRLLYGIPFIKNYFFLFPILFAILFFIWLVYIYLSNLSIQSTFSKNICKYLKKVKGGFICTNLMILIIFYIIFYLYFNVLYINNITRLSGHVLASILSGAILLNVKYVSDTFYYNSINTILMGYISVSCIVFLLHNVYCIFWTSLIFHKIPECIFSLIMSICVLVVIPHLNLDKLIISLFDFKLPVAKNKNIVYKKI